MRLRH